MECKRVYVLTRGYIHRIYLNDRVLVCLPCPIGAKESPPATSPRPSASVLSVARGKVHGGGGGGYRGWKVEVS